MSKENNIKANENINKMRELTDSIISEETLKKLDDNGYSMKFDTHNDFGVYSNVDGKEIKTYAIQNDNIYGITNTDYDVYYLKDMTGFRNVVTYIDDLVEDMDKISELKNKQEFINAVNSVTSKEQDKGMEM